jgi:hypothetical protein
VVYHSWLEASFFSAIFAGAECHDRASLGCITRDDEVDPMMTGTPAAGLVAGLARFAPLRLCRPACGKTPRNAPAGVLDAS